MSNLRSAVFLVLLGWAIGFGALGAVPKQQSIESALSQLRSRDWGQWVAAYTVVEHYHRRVSEALVEIVAKSREDDENADLYCATRLLTKYRAPESLPLLVEKVDYYQADAICGRSRLNGYPCALALRDIGPSSIPPMVSLLRSYWPEEVSDEAIYLYAWTIEEMPELGGVEEVIPAIRRAADRSEYEYKMNLYRLLVALEAIAERKQASSTLQEREFNNGEGAKDAKGGKSS